MRKTNLTPPTLFPIRHALIIEEANKPKNIIDTLDTATRMSLWSQMIDYLKNEPLTVEMLSSYCTKVVCYDTYGNKLFSHKELNGNKKEADITALSFMKDFKLPNADIGIASAFNLTLFNYEGMCEIPIFHKIKKSKNISSVPWLRNFGYGFIEGIKPDVERKYTKMQMGDVFGLDSFSSLQEPKVFYLEIPNSQLWEFLNKNNGVISHNDEKEIKLTPLKEEKPIRVAVAKNIESLIEEELFTLYKNSSHCLNCGKVLPFGLKAKFCARSTDNKICNRQRDTRRKKVSINKAK